MNWQQGLTSLVDVAVGALHANDSVCASFISPSRLYAAVFANQGVTYIAFFHVSKAAVATTVVACFHCLEVAVAAVHANDTWRACFISPSRLDASVLADQGVAYIAFLQEIKPALASTVIAFHHASTAASAQGVMDALTARGR